MENELESKTQAVIDEYEREDSLATTDGRPSSARQDRIISNSTSEKDAKASNRDPLQLQYSTTIVTWNAGGKNLDKDTIEDLKKKIFPDEHESPDIIIFSLQEARPSLRLKQNIAERVLKRCKDKDKKEAYAVCHNSKIDVFIYHERLFATQPNHMQTCLVIAYKKSSFPLQGQIKVIKSGESIEKDDPGHKGGIYAILSVHELNIGVIAVHLDSWNTETARQQADNVVTACRAAENPLDGIVIAGDFNTRLDREDLSNCSTLDQLKSLDDSEISTTILNIKCDKDNRNNNRLTRKLRHKPISQRVIEVFFQTQSEPNTSNQLPDTAIQKFAKESTALSDFTFFKLKNFTYYKSCSPNQNREDYLDVGQLDNIGFLNNSKTTLLDFTKQNNGEEVIKQAKITWLMVDYFRKWPMVDEFLGKPAKHASDHAAVIGALNLTCPARLNLLEHLTAYPIDDNDPETLDQLHEFLENKDQNVLRAYFDYVMTGAQAASEGGTSFPYYLQNIKLVKQDIRFIVSHLGHALHSQDDKNEPYINLIFGTSKIIEANENNNQEFIHEIYKGLLEYTKKDADKLAANLLEPFSKWLDDNKQKQEPYTSDDNKDHVRVNNSGARLTKEQQKKFHALHANKGDAELRKYFDYAIRSIQPAFKDDNSFPYYLKDIELVKEDIRFIVRHLGRALGWQANETEPYKKLIFGTCQAIEKKNDNTGKFMHEIYMQLLDDKVEGINQLKVALLGPFRKWLDDHNIKRAHYTLSGNASFFTVRKLEIFTQSRQTKIDLTEFENLNLTKFESINVR